MDKLDDMKLQATKKYLENEGKIDSLKKTQGDFFLVILVFVVAIVPTALVLELYLMISLVAVCLLPAAICAISQVQIDSIKKKCLDGKMNLKEFNEFLKSDEFKLYLDEVKKGQLNNINEVCEEETNDSSIKESKINETIIVNTKSKNNQKTNNRR